MFVVFLADSDRPIASLPAGLFRFGRCPVANFTPRVSRLDFPLRSPCFTCGTFRSFRLQPPCCCPRSLVWFSLRGLPRGTVFKPSTSRKGLVAYWASRVNSRLAAATGRIEFVSYGLTSHLPLLPTPPHDGCSYSRLQCSNPTLTGTCTPPIPHAHKRTIHHRSA